MSKRYKATIDPQAWINDYAVSCDAPGPHGPKTWDCTRELNELRQDHCPYIDRLLAEIAKHGEAIDRDDLFMGDPDAPAWVKEWQGPFTITIEEAD